MYTRTRIVQRQEMMVLARNLVRTYFPWNVWWTFTWFQENNLISMKSVREFILV